MLWGSFGIVHIITLLISAGIITGLYFWLRVCSDKTQTIVLGILSFSGIVAIIYNLVVWGSPIEYLPLHLCSLNAMVLPFAVFTKSKVLNNLLLLWALGAVLALVVNTAQADYEIFSGTFAIYYFPHTMEIGVPILMFLLGRVKKSLKCVGSTLLITFVSYTLIHFINLAINAYLLKNGVLDYAGVQIQVNYMYSITPENPVLALFYKIVPHQYWYMLLAFPVIVIYLVPIYMPELIAFFKKRRKTA